ncbi:MAG: hypothetical protein JWP59_985 [Massilia sp.]|nr:hypothetical protein [Massilia sp.]
MLIQSRFASSLRYAAATAVTATLLAPSMASAAAAAVAANLPPPGLYRVDSDATVIYRDGASYQQKVDGASNSVSLRVQSAKGKAIGATSSAVPTQVCIAAGAQNNGLPLPGMAANSTCKAGAPLTGPKGTVFSSRCDIADIDIGVRKLDARNWEMKTTVSEHLGPKGMLDFDQQRKMFETSLKNATSAEERADVQYTLDHWEEFKQEMRANAAASGAQAAPGAATRMSTATSRLTRVGESCKVAAAPAAGTAR